GVEEPGRGDGRTGGLTAAIVGVDLHRAQGEAAGVGGRQVEGVAAVACVGQGVRVVGDAAGGGVLRTVLGQREACDLLHRGLHHVGGDGMRYARSIGISGGGLVAD